MAWQIPLSTTGANTAATLPVDDDLYVAQGVVLASTQGNGIAGYGGGHDVRIYGTVVANQPALIMDGDPATTGNNRILIGSTGLIENLFENNGAYYSSVIKGYNTYFENNGTIRGSNVEIYGVSSTTQSTIINNGLMQGHEILHNYSSTEKLVVHNSGNINGVIISFDASLANAVDVIVNTGTMIGNVQLGLGDDTYDGSSGHIQGRILGQGGVDTLTGGTDNDTIDGGTEADIMAGGLGDDTYVVDVAGDVVTEAANAGTDTIKTALATYSIAALANIENLTGTSGTGQSLTGNGNTNVINAGGGNDVLNGGAGADTMIGGNGNDTYYVDSSSDFVTEAAGAAAGTDSVYAAASYALGANVENLYALAAGLTLTGNELGNSFLDFATGAGTTLAGGAGNDTYSIRNANSTVTEAAGTAGGGDAVYAYTSFNLATRGANVENILANAAGLTITGNDLNNGLYDFAASGSTMVGGAGSDTYFVRNGNSLITEAVGPAAGTDTVYAYASFDLSMRGANVEVLRSNTTAGIVLTGNDLGNTIMGGTGADTLVGKLGLDTLTGGAGADRFVFNTAASAANFDTLTDFSHADDTISLSKTSFAALTGAAGAGIDPSQFNAVLSTAVYEANDRIIYQTDTGKLFYDADGYGAGTQAAVQIALLTTKPQDIAANDFLLIA